MTPALPADATLIERLEAAQEGSLSLDMQIVVAFDIRPDWAKKYGPMRIEKDGDYVNPAIRVRTGNRASRGDPRIDEIPIFTRNIDTALWLIDRTIWTAIEIRSRNGWSRFVVEISRLDAEDIENYECGYATTAPLALCIAALRARSARP